MLRLERKINEKSSNKKKDKYAFFFSYPKVLFLKIQNKTLSVLHPQLILTYWLIGSSNIHQMIIHVVVKK